MAKVKGTCGNFRKEVEALMPPLPKGSEAKKAERKRRKAMAKGPALDRDELCTHLNGRRMSGSQTKSARQSREREIARRDRSQQW